MKDIDIVLQDLGNARVLLSAFQTMLDHSVDMIFIKDTNLTYLGATVPFVKMAGKETVEDIIGKTDFDLFEDENLVRRYVADEQKLLSSGENLKDFIEPITDKNGHARYGMTSKYLLTDGKGEVIGLMGVTRDVTKEILAEQDHQRTLEYLFELPGDAYAATYLDIDDWRIVNERRQSIGQVLLPMYESVDALVESVMSSIQDEAAANDFGVKFSKQNLKATYESGKRTMGLEYQRNIPGGDARWVRCEFTLLVDPANRHLCSMVVLRDIDEEKQVTQKILQAAATDEMTGLLNRAETMKNIRHFLSGDGRDGCHALMVIDVDNFKKVNDTFGHREGDRFLIQFAQAVRGCFRNTDIVGRIGGDEFFVLMKDVPSIAALEEKTASLMKAMQRACDEYAEQGASGSIGVSCYRDGCTLDQLYEQADQALYQAKRQGKNRVVFAEKTED